MSCSSRNKRQTFAGSQIVFPLLELGNDFPVGRNRLPFIEAVRLPGRFQDVADFVRQFAFGNALLVSGSETVGNGQQGRRPC